MCLSRTEEYYVDTGDKKILLSFIFNMGSDEPYESYSIQCDGYEPIKGTETFSMNPPSADDVAKECIANGYKFYRVERKGRHDRT